MKSYRWLIIAAILSVFTLPACAPRARLGETLPPTLPAERMAVLEQRAEQWQGYQAMVHISAESTKGTLRRIRSVILASPPHRFRLEAMSIFGQSVGLFLFDHERANLWIPAEKVVYSATDGGTLVQHLLGIPIPMEVFVYSLAGVIPQEDLAQAKSEPTELGWRLHSQDPSGQWTTSWELGARPFVLKEIRVRGQDLNVAVRFEPFVDLEGGTAPGRLVFTAEDWQMEVKIDQIKSVDRFQEGAFQANFPRDVRKLDLDRKGWKGESL
jgi:outer membrane biogenesis lipoprotein LolB